MNKPDPARLVEGQDNLRRLLAMRWLAVAGEAAAIAIAPLLLGIPLPLVPMLGIVALQAAFNLHAHGRLRRGAPVAEGELVAHLGVDMMALTLLLFFSGGAANPFVSFYLPPIAVAATILSARAAWGIALSLSLIHI